MRFDRDGYEESSILMRLIMYSRSVAKNWYGSASVGAIAFCQEESVGMM